MLRRFLREAMFWVLGAVAAALVFEFLTLTRPAIGCERSVLFYLKGTSGDCDALDRHLKDKK